jgi:hypothetical protein
MNRTLETYLLSMLAPAVALVVFVFLERRKKSAPDEVLEPADSSIAQPKIKLILNRKR